MYAHIYIHTYLNMFTFQRKFLAINIYIHIHINSFTSDSMLRTFDKMYIYGDFVVRA